MKVTLNGYELPKHADGNRTVGEVLDQLREEITSGGKIVTAVFLDDQQLPGGWKRREELKRPVSSVDCLEITVDEPEAIRQRALTDAAVLASRLAAKAAPLAKQFRIGDEVAANNGFAEFIEELKLVVSGLDFTTRGLEGNEAAEDIRRRMMDAAGALAPHLDSIYKAQAAGDYVTVADELEYELPKQIVDWTTLLTEARRAFSQEMQFN